MKSLEKLLSEDNLIIMGSQEYPIDFTTVAYWGGMGTVAQEVSERLVQEGFEVLVLPRRVQDYSARGIYYKEQNGVHILSLPTRLYKAGKENSDLYNYYPVRDGTLALDHSYTTWRYLEKHGINKNIIVHGHDWMSVGWIREARRLGLKRVFTVHMSQKRDSGIAGMRLKDKRLELERIAGESADIIHYVSLAQMKSCKIYHWNHNKKQVVIPNGVNINKYIPPEENSVEDYILFVGRLTPVKNVPQLILGWSVFNKEFPEVKLKILGASGVANSDVERTISSLDAEQKSKIELRIEMIPEAERIKYYQKASVSCFPSSQEAFGIVAIEAQACGHPVVVGDVGGFKENVLEGITGVHVQGEKSASIAEGLKLAYLNKKSWGKNARRLVISFYDWDKLVKDYINELYK